MIDYITADRTFGEYETYTGNFVFVTTAVEVLVPEIPGLSGAVSVRDVDDAAVVDAAEAAVARFALSCGPDLDWLGLSLVEYLQARGVVSARQPSSWSFEVESAPAAAQHRRFGSSVRVVKQPGIAA